MLEKSREIAFGDISQDDGVVQDLPPSIAQKVVKPARFYHAQTGKVEVCRRRREFR